MPIHKPGRVLLHHAPLKFVRSRVTGHGRKSADTPIALVPFIDFLVTLVVFLLSSFSATGELLAQQPNLTMPQAKNVVDLEVAPAIAINSQVVLLDGERVADTATLARDAEVQRIEQLVQRLEQVKRNWSIIHPQKPFPGAVVIQADQNVDFRVVKKAMASAAQAGYGNISFAVNRAGGGGGAE